MTGKMKAWVFYEPMKMEWEEVDIPQLAPDEVLVKIKACGFSRQAFFLTTHRLIERTELVLFTWL